MVWNTCPEKTFRTPPRPVESCRTLRFAGPSPKNNTYWERLSKKIWHNSMFRIEKWANQRGLTIRKHVFEEDNIQKVRGSTKLPRPKVRNSCHRPPIGSRFHLRFRSDQRETNGITRRMREDPPGMILWIGLFNRVFLWVLSFVVSETGEWGDPLVKWLVKCRERTSF